MEVKLRNGVILPWVYVFLPVVVSRNEETPRGWRKISEELKALSGDQKVGKHSLTLVRSQAPGPVISQIN